VTGFLDRGFGQVARAQSVRVAHKLGAVETAFRGANQSQISGRIGRHRKPIALAQGRFPHQHGGNADSQRIAPFHNPYRNPVLIRIDHFVIHG